MNIERMSARVEMTKQLNDLLGKMTKESWLCRVFGLIRWWDVEALVAKWIKENTKGLSQ